MSASSVSTQRTQSAISPVAALVGVVFLLVGILGFIPGITTHYSDLQFMGHNSGAKLLGLFEVSILHNLVHILFGVAGLAASRASASAARSYLMVGGVIYLVLWVYGLVIEMGSNANFVPLNNADNWLHLVLGIAMIALGLVLGRSASTSAW